MFSPTLQESQDEKTAFQQWCFQKTVEIEHCKQSLADEQKEFDIQKRKLEQEKKDFYRRKESEEKLLAHETNLFNMKLQILEAELKKLAAEKEHIEKQKAFYSRVNQYQQETNTRTTSWDAGEVFFKGVRNGAALKKRYRDLIKIYHPDNQGGDTTILQEINRVYTKLNDSFSA